MKRILPLNILCIFILLILTLPAYTQNDEPKTPWLISLNYRNGENKPHRAVIKNLTYPYQGIEAKFGWQSIGKQPWQVAYRYPSYGIGFNWNTFKTDIIGEPVALYFFTNFPQITTKYWRLDLEVDLGFSYGINPFHETQNPYNFSTGSSGNAFFGLYLESSFHIDQNVDIFFSGGLSHYSNGAVGYPNYGLNIPSVKAGVRFQSNFYERINKGILPDYKRNLQLNLYVGGGQKKLLNPNDIFRELVIQPSLFYRVSYKRRIGLSYDVIYNQAINGVYTRKQDTGRDLITQAVLVSHEFLINRFTVLTQMGVYVDNLPFDLEKYNRFDIDCILTRLGIGYYITPWARTVLNLKAHYIKAEYIELGLIFDINLYKE